ncbi:MAG: hypothetical protein K0Q74_1457 [Gammaproteobacteria bacterium]|nr:hypothetical protein [Gammaproteobacteria bacterium]
MPRLFFQTNNRLQRTPRTAQERLLRAVTPSSYNEKEVEEVLPIDPDLIGTPLKGLPGRDTILHVEPCALWH